MPTAAPAAAVTAADRARAAQRAQAGLATILLRALGHAWGQVDPAAIEKTLPVMWPLVTALVNRYGLASASLAARFYDQQRRAAGIATHFAVRPAALPDPSQIDATIGWATAPARAQTPNLDLARTQLDGAVNRMVLEVGRNTIIENARRDRQATHWARVTEPGCCWFCALLASRGAVYKHDTVDFRAHNHCRCAATPIFSREHYEPPANVREWQQMYDSVKGRGSAATVRRNFRRVYEGRADSHGHQHA